MCVCVCVCVCARVCACVCARARVCESQSCSTLRPHRLQPARFLCPWNSPGKNTRVGCHSLLQGIFPTQGSNPGLPRCRRILYHLSHQGSLQWCVTSSKTAQLGVIQPLAVWGWAGAQETLPGALHPAGTWTQGFLGSWSTSMSGTQDPSSQQPPLTTDSGKHTSTMTAWWSTMRNSLCR